MKCEDFEFEYTVAPNEIAGDADEHLQSCAACQNFTQSQLAFEQQLASVINCAVPDGLRHSLREYVATNKSAFWSMSKTSVALAASLILAVGIVSINFLPRDSGGLPIDQLVVQHFEHDGANSMKTSHQVSSQLLAQVSEQFGVRIKLASDISFVEKCPIGDSYGLHMVYQYQGKPITVIYMPEISPKEAIMINYSGVKGWVKPLQNGSMAVLTSTINELPSVEQADQSIEWL